MLKNIMYKNNAVLKNSKNIWYQTPTEIIINY